MRFREERELGAEFSPDSSTLSLDTLGFSKQLEDHVEEVKEMRGNDAMDALLEGERRKEEVLLPGEDGEDNEAGRCKWPLKEPPDSLELYFLAILLRRRGTLASLEAGLLLLLALAPS